MTSFQFTRAPSTKTSVGISTKGLTPAVNELVIIARRGASGGSATTGVPVLLDNFGDYLLAATECTTKFGASSEISEMVVAAIKGVLFSDLVDKQFPKLRVIPLANDAVAADLAGVLAANIVVKMPFVVVPFPMTDATARGALKAHLTAISASDRGSNGQFGSFGVMATDGILSTVTAASEANGSELLLFPWLRDGAVTKANKIHAVAAAYAAVCASTGIPYLPLNEIVVGGLVPPVASSDWHTSGDAGTEALGLESGLVPLMVASDGTMKISRTITSRRSNSAAADASYYDMQDWQKLYYFRMNVYLLSTQARYKRAHASDQKLLALRSEIIATAKEFERLDMFQHVDDLVEQFKCTRVSGNRHAAVYEAPTNCIPGFHNKGIGITGTDEFDTFELA